MNGAQKNKPRLEALSLALWASLRSLWSKFPFPTLVRKGLGGGGFPIFMLLLFLGAMFWAKAQDPFSRRWFTLKTADRGSFHCVAVLPKPVRRVPVVVYAHGSGGSLMTDGNDLRQMAELGLATVSLDYDETNAATFNAQWSALLLYLGGQGWADTNAVAWVGFSLGAERTLNFALQLAAQQPQLLVQISGSGLPSDDQPRIANPHLRCPVLVVHGEQDEVFPLAETRSLFTQLQTNGVPVTLRILAGLSHSLDPERGVVFHRVGEYCLTHLAGPDAWRNYHSIAQWQAEAPGLWVFWLPAMGWVGIWILRKKAESGWRERDLTAKQRISPASLRSPAGRLGRRSSSVLPWLAAILATAALADTALHLVPPHFPVSGKTLVLVRRFLVQPKDRADFEFLAAQPIWSGVKLRVLLDHVELAVYNRELINWTLADPLYREDVLAPAITGLAGEGLDWRRPLWEEFYPRIRHESSPEDAARIVVRHLHERVTVVALANAPRTVPDIWRRQITDARGFKIISVAALRSVGVPARLNARDEAEFWDGTAWKALAKL
jgi:acetyl esterase/lipase